MKVNKELNKGRIQQPSSCQINKYRFNKSQTHFFLSAFGKEYLCFAGQKSFFIVAMEGRVLKLIKTVQMPEMEIVDICSTGNGDINILHRNGICWQYVDYLIQDASFRSFKFEEKVQPKRLVMVEEKSYIVVCQDKTLMFVNNQKVFKRLQFPSIMDLDKLVINCEKRESFEPKLIVPCKDQTYPYVFSGKEIDNWENKHFLIDFKQKCQQFYLGDQKLTYPHSELVFSASDYLIYVCSQAELLVLSLKRGLNEGMDYFCQTRLKIKTHLQSIPMFMSVSNTTGQLLIIEKERLVAIHPTKYIKPRMKIKQKNTQGKGMIFTGYTLQNGAHVFMMNDPEATKLGVFQKQ